jgi:hypothetical protein
LKKVDWTKFEQLIREKSIDLNDIKKICLNTDTDTESANIGNLESAAIQLQILISDAAEKFTPKLRQCAKSKP